MNVGTGKTGTQIFKKIAAFALIMMTVAMVVPFGEFEAVYAATSINSADKASGASYTASAALAAKLDTVFAGNIGLSKSSSFKSTVSAPLGSSKMTGSNMYYIKNKTTGSVTSGWQCFIYANAVYNTLFNEYIGRAQSLSNSKVLISGGSSKASYDQFSKAGVKCGAYMRTTTKKNGAYNGSAGHSLIVLSYNANQITYLEGNADGRGLVRIVTRTWSDFNKNQLSGRSRYICHVVQPTDKYYNSLYSASSGSAKSTTATTTTAKKTTTTTTKKASTTVDPASCKVAYRRVLSYKKTVMTGSDVKYVQTCLKYLGYSVTVNSKFDTTTQTALKKFQKDNSLTADGKCGSVTWKALEKAVARKTPSSAVKGVSVTKGTALKITSQPVDSVAAIGGKVFFTVKAEGAGLTYQWQLSDDNGKTWRNSSVKTADYSTTLSKTNAGRLVRCIVTDCSGAKVTSSSAAMKTK